MANGGINKVGCAYHRCSDYYDGDAEPFLLFVCKYGDPPLYTEGPPCDSCKDRCILNALCDTKIS
ncbi:hypothetical protein DICVIV_11088 [Dictyocaulus viviparus]|uniref:SCP domain-containing protein n=1 Tax=Dictyocaulus viviparus TaxID=29172 RepID=A0A0D8XGR2_DICVI|nr:hypothetical protein DICVIV_11088 [Dictyocaulus viviparus]